MQRLYATSCAQDKCTQIPPAKSQRINWMGIGLHVWARWAHPYNRRNLKMKQTEHQISTPWTKPQLEIKNMTLKQTKHQMPTRMKHIGRSQKWEIKSIWTMPQVILSILVQTNFQLVLGLESQHSLIIRACHVWSQNTIWSSDSRQPQRTIATIGSHCANLAVRGNHS